MTDLRLVRSQGSLLKCYGGATLRRIESLDCSAAGSNYLAFVGPAVPVLCEDLAFRRLAAVAGTVLSYLNCAGDHNNITVEDSPFSRFFYSTVGNANFSRVSVSQVTADGLAFGATGVTMADLTIDKSNISIGFQLTAALALSRLQVTRSSFSRIAQIDTNIASGLLYNVTVIGCVTSDTAFVFNSPNVVLTDALISNSVLFGLLNVRYGMLGTGLMTNLTRVEVANNEFNSTPITLGSTLVAACKSVTLRNNTAGGSLVTLTSPYIQLTDLFIGDTRLTSAGHLLVLAASGLVVVVRVHVSANTVPAGDAIHFQAVSGGITGAFVGADIFNNSLGQGSVLDGDGPANLFLILGQLVNNSVRDASASVMKLSGRILTSFAVRTSRVSYYPNQVNQTFSCQSASLVENGVDLCRQTCPADQCNTCTEASNSSNLCVVCGVAWGAPSMCDCPYWSKLSCPLGCQVNTSWCPEVLDCTGTTVVCNATKPLPSGDITITNTSVYILGNQSITATIVVGSGSALYFTECGDLSSQFLVDVTTITDGGQLVLASSGSNCLSYNQSTSVGLIGTESRSCETVTAQPLQTSSSYFVLFSVQAVPDCVTGVDFVGSSSEVEALTRALTTTTIVLVGVFLGLILVIGVALSVFLLWRSHWCQERRTGARKHQMAREGDFVDDSDEVELDRLARRQNYSSLEPSATISTNL